tara:strand:- start:3485 stop:3880 length:396 start_codon:yes stop_codon:yes gene_type:complete
MNKIVPLDDGSRIVGVENSEHINTTNTSKRGTVTTTYDELVRAFGEPTLSTERGDQMDKTHAEWMLEFEVEEQGKDAYGDQDYDLIVATVYDWKYPQLPRDSAEWNIGGFSRDGSKAAWLVQDYLNHMRNA